MIIVTSLHEWICQGKFYVFHEWSWKSGEAVFSFVVKWRVFEKLQTQRGCIMDRRSVWNDWKSGLEASQGFVSTLSQFRVSSSGEWGKSCSNGIYELLGNCRKLGSVRFAWFRFSGLENVDTTGWFAFILNHSVRLTYPVPVSRVYYLS